MKVDQSEIIEEIAKRVGALVSEMAQGNSDRFMDAELASIEAYADANGVPFSVASARTIVTTARDGISGWMPSSMEC